MWLHRSAANSGMGCQQQAETGRQVVSLTFTDTAFGIMIHLLCPSTARTLRKRHR